MDVEIETTVEGEIDFKGMIRRLKELDGKKVTAGLFGGMSQKKAMWNEYGTSRGIPARPFLRNTLYEQAPHWGDFIAPKIAALLDGAGADPIPALGKEMVDSLHKTIDAGNFAALAPSTVARKGSAKPLIDTGDMYGSISWKEGG